MTRLFRPRRLGLSAVLLLACGDIASPVRDDLYEWRLIVPTGATPDTVHFHWARGDLPVAVWVEDVENLPELTRRAIDTWEAVYLYGEFRGRLVDDSVGADILVRGTPAPNAVAAEGRRLSSALAPECSGATDLDLSDDLGQLRLPIRIFLDPVSGDIPNLQRCLELTTIHEMGHAIGIFAHSPDPADIMHANPQVERLSTRDRETAEALYHLPPTITLVRSPPLTQ